MPTVTPHRIRAWGSRTLPPMASMVGGTKPSMAFRQCRHQRVMTCLIFRTWPAHPCHQSRLRRRPPLTRTSLNPYRNLRRTVQQRLYYGSQPHDYQTFARGMASIGSNIRETITAIGVAFIGNTLFPCGGPPLMPGQYGLATKPRREMSRSRFFSRCAASFSRARNRLITKRENRAPDGRAALPSPYCPQPRGCKAIGPADSHHLDEMRKPSFGFIALLISLSSFSRQKKPARG